MIAACNGKLKNSLSRYACLAYIYDSKELVAKGGKEKDKRRRSKQKNF
jgi:hypothetical protein